MKNMLFMLAFSMVSMMLIQESSAVKQIRKTRIYQSKFLEKKKEFNLLDSIEKYKSLLKEKPRKLPVKKRLFVHDVD